jgi:peroxiredoxin
VLAVSTDSVEVLKKFREDRKAPYPFLSDPGGKVAAQYAGLMPVVGLATRANFVIDRDGKILSIITGSDAVDPAASVAACPAHR